MGFLRFSLSLFFLAVLLPAETTLTFATFLGAESGEVANGVALDAEGNVYIVGQTRDMEAMPGSVNLPGGTTFDVFVAKFTPAGDELLYLAVFGGSAREQGTALALDDKGSAYVAGWTFSEDFPATPGAAQTVFGGGSRDAFVAKLSPDGSTLEYAGYIGGERLEDGSGIAVGADGSVYVVGQTGSDAFPTTPDALRTLKTGALQDAFVTKLSPDGSTFEYSTYLGGSARDEALAITLDGGRAIVVGLTESVDFPTTAAVLQPAMAGVIDAFICSIAEDGGSIDFAGYYGGSVRDEATSVVLDAAGNIFIAGRTRSSDLPTSPQAFQSVYGGGAAFGDMFAAKFSPDAGRLLAATYVGGASEDEANGIFVDDRGNVFLAGTSGSPNFPITPDAVQTTLDLLDEGVLLQLSPNFRELMYSTYLGGSGGDRGFAIAGEPRRDVLIAGTSSSANFPTTAGTVQPILASFREGGDAYVARFEFQPDPAFSGAALVNAATLESGSIAPGEIISIFGAGLGPLEGLGLQLGPDGRITTEIATTRVFVDGVAAPMLFASDRQVNAIVPFATPAQGFGEVVVEFEGSASAPARYFLAPSRPGIFSLDGSGIGQAAVLNQDFSVNGVGNAAAPGSVVQVFATGGGVTVPASVDGELTAVPLPELVGEVSLTIGDVEAEILYAGPAPGLVAGVVQVNARIPGGLMGTVALGLSVGERIGPEEEPTIEVE